MTAPSLVAFLKARKADLPKGPIAIIFAEDDVEIGSNIRHHARTGFANILLLAREAMVLPTDCQDICH